jgi:hypothetical protein
VSITPLAVTLAGTRVYDGSTAAAGSILTVTNLVGSDVVGISGAGTLAAKDVGSEALTSTSGLSLTNPDYTLVGSSGAVSITAATLTYTADPTARTYGSANPAFTGQVIGFVGTDTLASATTGTLSFSSPASATSGVGGYAINGQGLTADAGDYNFVQASGNAAALTINPLAVTLSGARVYDGSTAAAASILTITNLVGADVVGLSGTGTLAAKDVGAEALTFTSGMSLTNPNYTLAGASGSVTITPATLTYVADPAQRTYGSANPAFTGHITGFVGTDTLANATTGTLGFTSPASASSGVGAWAINGAGLVADDGDYIFLQASGNASALTITPLTPPVSQSAARVYDPISCGAGSRAPALSQTSGVAVSPGGGAKGGCSRSQLFQHGPQASEESELFGNLGAWVVQGSSWKFTQTGPSANSP